jgi:hypothetical protein
MAKKRLVTPQSTPMALLITAVAGLITFLIYLVIIPYIGGTVQQTMPSISNEICSYGAGPLLTYGVCNGTGNITGYGSQWNSTYNTALPQASSIYTNVIPIVTACVTFIFLGLLFFYLRGMIF